MTRKTSLCSVKHNTRKISKSGIKYLQASSLPGELPGEFCLTPESHACCHCTALLVPPQASWHCPRAPTIALFQFYPCCYNKYPGKNKFRRKGVFFQMTVLSCRPSHRNCKHLIASYPQLRAKRCANMLTCISACFLHSYLLGPLPRE